MISGEQEQRGARAATSRSGIDASDMCCCKSCSALYEPRRRVRIEHLKVDTMPIRLGPNE
jgi:hypothetical protein